MRLMLMVLEGAILALVGCNKITIMRSRFPYATSLASVASPLVPHWPAAHDQTDVSQSIFLSSKQRTDRLQFNAEVCALVLEPSELCAQGDKAAACSSVIVCPVAHAAAKVASSSCARTVATLCS